MATIPTSVQFKFHTEKKVEVIIYEKEEVIQRFACSPMSEKKQKDICNATGLNLRVVLKAFADCVAQDVSIELKQTSRDYIAFIRGIYETKDKEKPYAAASLDTLLTDILHLDSYSAVEPIFRFDDERVCVLDVDYHGSYVPPEDLLNCIALSVRPVPAYWWRSHGGGCKMVFNSQAGFTARELASVAAFAWQTHCKEATFELSSGSRLPLFGRRKGGIGGMPIRGVGEFSVEKVKEIYQQTVSDEDRDEILQQYHLTLGSTYPHSTCLIDSAHQSDGEPVKVGEYGIYCFSCSGRKLCYGNCYVPGFVPFVVLRGETQSRIYKLVASFTHWHHAKYVLGYCTTLPVEILQLMYKTALKLYHGVDDVRVDMVFKAEKMIRLAGQWVFDGDIRSTAVLPNKLNIFRKLPAAYSAQVLATGEKKYELMADKVEILSHPGKDLTDMGYPDLTIVKGMPVYGVHNKYPSSMIPVADSFAHLPSDRKPKYVAKSKRMTAEEYQSTIEEVFPKISWDYLKLLICCKGLAEGDLLNPMILVKGASGSGKSITVEIAAGLLGDHTTPLVWTSNQERLRQLIQSGIMKGSFVNIDEVFKNSEAEKKTPVQALDPLLNLTPSSESHKLYTGSVPLGKNFCLVFSDIDLPQEVKNDIQLSRRVLYHCLTDPVPEWREIIPHHGIKTAGDVRMVSRKMCHAADSFISSIIDECFSPGCTISDVLELCGASFLTASTDFKDSYIDLRTFLSALLDAPDSTDKHKPEGEGWKMITSGDVTPFREAWDAVANGKSGKAWETSRRCAEVGWSRIEPSVSGVQLDVIPYQTAQETKLFLRFRQGEFRRPMKTNREIFLEKQLTGS